MALVKEYIDRYRGDEMEDIFKLLERRLLQVVADYARKKEWKNPQEWIQKILNDQELGKETQEFWVQALLNHGYYNKNLVKESLDFERGMDPKKALNLGIPEQILKYAKLKCHLGDFSWSSPSGWLWEIQEDKEIPMDTKLIWYEYLQEHPEYLKISMDEHGNVSEAQEFQRGLAPKISMGVGLEGVINDFMEDNSPEQPQYWIHDLLDNSELKLDDEKRAEWIKFLLTKPKYTSDLDENDYIDLWNKKIDWIPFVPLTDTNFKYRKLANNFILSFGGWEDFSPYFDYDSRDLSQDFIENVLSGNGYDEFNYDSEAFKDVGDLGSVLKRSLNKGKKIPALKDLKKKAIEMGGIRENMDTIEDLFTEINDNEDLGDLKKEVSIAFEDAQISADESDAYKRIKGAIEKQFEIEEKGKWIGEGSDAIFEIPITFAGLRKLAYTLATKEEEIKYYHPYGGYSGDIDAATFNDAMYSRLEDL